MPNRITTRRGLAALAILLANASCMPQAVSRRETPAIRLADAARRAPAARDTLIADPLPVLLAASPAEDEAAAPVSGEAPPFVAAGATTEDSSRAIGCLTEAVYYEARSEPEDGQRAVAQVVLNRVRNPAFPASVCGVVHQRSSTSGVCQFTYYCDGAMLFRRDEIAWARARRIATEAYGGAVYAPTGTATFYHTTAVMPWWAARLTRIAAIGAHIFYRLGDAVGGRLDFRQAYAAAEPRADTAESDAVLTANVVRFLTPEGPAVSVHRDATSIAGVVVHRGTSSEVMPLAEVAGVRVHVGMPSSTAVAEDVPAIAAPATAASG